MAAASALVLGAHSPPLVLPQEAHPGAASGPCRGSWVACQWACGWACRWRPLASADMESTGTSRRLRVVRPSAPVTPVDEAPEAREDYWRRMQEMRAELARLRAG